MRNINDFELIKAITKLSTVLINNDSAQDYTATKNSEYAAKQFASAFDFTVDHYEQLLQLRQVFDESLQSKYNVDLMCGISAFTQDVEADMRKAKVPQKVRVMAGLFDSIVVAVGVKVGAVEFKCV